MFVKGASPENTQKHVYCIIEVSLFWPGARLATLSPTRRVQTFELKKHTPRPLILKQNNKQVAKKLITAETYQSYSSTQLFCFSAET
jgi:hypothetical protein